jgi:hypothetical protein
MSVLEGDEWSTSYFGHFTSGSKQAGLIRTGGWLTYSENMDLREGKLCTCRESNNDASIFQPVNLLRLSRFILEHDQVAIVEEDGWAPGLVRTGAENRAYRRHSIPGPSSPSTRKYFIYIFFMFSVTCYSYDDLLNCLQRLVHCVCFDVSEEHDAHIFRIAKKKITLQGVQIVNNVI